eukprot:4489980-Amphidinium_carterae.1
MSTTCVPCAMTSHAVKCAACYKRLQLLCVLHGSSSTAILEKRTAPLMSMHGLSAILLKVLCPVLHTCISPELWELDEG